MPSGKAPGGSRAPLLRVEVPGTGDSSRHSGQSNRGSRMKRAGGNPARGGRVARATVPRCLGASLFQALGRRWCESKSAEWPGLPGFLQVGSGHDEGGTRGERTSRLGSRGRLLPFGSRACLVPKQARARAVSARSGQQRAVFGSPARRPGGPGLCLPRQQM